MFTGALADKTYDDLITFLQTDLPEGLRLDYKSNFPSKLEKTLAAMANTEGGVVLVGVEEDADRPRYPMHGTPKGVDVDQAVERVISKAYQAIREPLFPEVESIPIPEKPGKCVVVIRIQPSERAPHAVSNGEDVYVRVDSQAFQVEREKRAEVEQLDWLFRRRTNQSGSVTAALERAEEAIGFGRQPPNDHFGVELVVHPAVPHAQPLDIGQLSKLATQGCSLGAYSEFPHGPMRFIAGGGD